MSPEDVEEVGEQFLAALAAWDEALAAGTPSAAALDGVLSAAERVRLAKNVAFLERLQRLRPGPASATDTPRDPTQPTDPTKATLPRTLGRFHIRRELGRGGFGVVFLAFDPPLGREVALKVPRAEALVTPELSGRFRHEALAAARLDHPNIVPVYEAGEAGPVSYIASTYCSGPTLAAWLKERVGPVPAREAAALIAALANAVQHAHSRGVLHRDLKPSNVLLEPVPGGPGYVPRITDFGLAKLFGASADPECRTLTGVALGTPGYMAPEQVSGKVKEVTTAADVYALGAILYELLTGRPPFQGATPLETMEQVRSLDPVPARRLRPDVPRDVENICAKCLQKDPGRRYAGAHALADDLQRFLDGEPVFARPVSAWERGWKWARRRPVAATLVGVSALAVAGAIAAGLWHNSRLNWYNRELEDSVRVAQAESEHARAEWKRAEGNLDEAKEVVDKFLTRIGRYELAGVPQMEHVRRELLERALRFYQTSLQQRGNDPSLRRETARAHYQVGYIHSLLGNHREAADGFEQSRLIWNGLRAEGRVDHHVPGELADTLNQKGEALRKLGKSTDAVGAHREARGLLEGATATTPNHAAALRHRLADTLNYLGVALLESGETVDAEQALRQSLAISEEVLETVANETTYRESLANCAGNLGLVLQRRSRFEEAESYYQQAIDLFESLADEFPTQPLHRKQLAAALGNMSSVQKALHRAADAEAFDLRAIQLMQRLVADFPRVPDYRKDLAQHRYNLAILWRATGRPGDAEKAYRGVRDDMVWLVERAPNVPEYRGLLAAALNNLHALQQNRNEIDEARRSVQAAIAHAQKARDLDPANPAYRVSLGNYHRNYIVILLNLKDHRAAAEATAALVRVDPDNAPLRFACAGYLAWCVRLADKDERLDGGYTERAMGELREAVRLGFRDVQRLKTSPELEALRGRADFQQLLAELDVRSKPSRAGKDQ
ncbi:MAG TPA: protein kinase [Gemmataceae bacterium]|nr:protein kinase [Gemmataceae bacterium]